MLGLRQKLSLGFGSLLIIMLIIGIQSMRNFEKLGGSVDMILRENYRSIVASQQMDDALERIDSGLLLILLGESARGGILIDTNKSNFDGAMLAASNNVTLPGEGEKVRKIRDLYSNYKILLAEIEKPGLSAAGRRDAYFDLLLPLFGKIKEASADLLQMNQNNMIEANNRARRNASEARKRMFFLLSIGTVVAFCCLFLTGKWILRPIQRLIRSADEIRRGNLDLVVMSHSRDEIGHLSESFNAMAESLREFRRTDQAKFVMIQRATQQAFNSLPDAVAVVDTDGKIRVATELAKTIFGLFPGVLVFDAPLKAISDLFREVLQSGRRTVRDGNSLVQQFVKGEERYFRPEAVPIRDHERLMTGIVLVLQDVTQLQQQNEIKRGVIRTVSHQLKTPLTSIRMAIHLLLEEKLGPLTNKQADLLLAAREDSERLNGILADLLNINRLESGKAQMDLQSASPRMIVEEALEPQRRSVQDRGIKLEVEVGDDFPDVLVDMPRIHHVFGNLITNALAHTPPGGRIQISVSDEPDSVIFCISDTGAGIPERYLSRIFEPFFRIPGRSSAEGEGLGLAIVKEIVEAHGGTVDVESQEGKGTSFRFTLRKTGRSPEEKERP